jgi:hypothetical protein
LPEPRLLYVRLVARARFAFVLLGLPLVGCPQQPPPESVRVELPSVVVNRDPIRPVVRARRSRQSTTVAKGAYTVRAEPPALATTSSDGTLSCAKSGDGTVIVDVQGVRAKAALRCRLVDRVEVEELPTIDIKNGAVLLEARAVDKAGKELTDVPISVSPTNTEPLTVRDFQVTPVAVGSTTLVVRAAHVERKINVRVVRSIDFEAQPLRGGRRIDISLPKGNHEIEVTLREPKELRIDWRGARQCNYMATAATHRSSCVLEDKGGAVVDNPAFVESGETKIAKDRVLVRQIP